MTSDIQTHLLDAIMPHVAFDGWGPVSFEAAVADIGIAAADAHAACPRGAVDLAVLAHKQGDSAMVAAMAAADLTGMRYSEKVAHAIRLRLVAAGDREVVRRATSLFALPMHAGEGAALIWGTADAIWTALGDTSTDGNWYSKRATLSAVYGSVVLFWLGDQADATDDFIDRRIENVMQFEKFKGAMNANPLFKPLTAPLGRLMATLKAPSKTPRTDVPGYWQDPEQDTR